MERSLHQPGMVNENVLEIDFEPLCDGTMRRHSLADLRLLEGLKIFSDVDTLCTRLMNKFTTHSNLIL